LFFVCLTRLFPF